MNSVQKVNGGKYKIVFDCWMGAATDEEYVGYNAWDYLPTGADTKLFDSEDALTLYICNHAKGPDAYGIWPVWNYVEVSK